MVSLKVVVLSVLIATIATVNSAPSCKKGEIFIIGNAGVSACVKDPLFCEEDNKIACSVNPCSILNNIGQCTCVPNYCGECHVDMYNEKMEQVTAESCIQY